MSGVEYVELWQAEVKDGEISGGDERGRDLLRGVIGRLVSEYDPGILAVVDVIRVVNNIQPAMKTAPYAMMIKEGGKSILLLDIDAFSDEELLYIVLEHELKESIMTIIPYESEALEVL